MINKFKILCLVFFISFVTQLCYSADIIISGNKRISNETILNILNSKKNNYSEKDLNNLQKKLFETNFFNKVEIKFKDNKVLITLNENPIVNFFNIEGVINKSREDLLYKNLSLGPNKIYSNFLLKNDIETIKTIYVNSGYLDALVIPEVSLNDDNSININIKIERNNKFKINRIFFNGDKYFSSSVLSDAITASENGWWKFLSNTTVANINRLEYDKQLLKNFYLDQGFYDAQIISGEIERIDNNSINIVFSINSGKIYNFGKIKVEDSNRELNDQNLENIYKIINKKLRGPYSKNSINTVVEEINDFFILNKIEFISVQTREVKNDKNNINLDFVINKTPRFYVNQIEITGNNITEEKVVRRNLTFSEGDSFANYKLIKSLNNIKNLGIFKNVTHQKSQVENSELINLVIKVEEMPTGSISAGIGAGSSGASVSTGLNETNLFGMGINSNINFSVGTEKISGTINFNIPDFNNSENDLGYELYIVDTDYSNAGYESKVIGNDIYTNYEVFEDIILNVGLGIDQDTIETKSSASNIYKSQEGDFITLKSFYNVISDKRNRRIQPSKGYRNSFGQKIAVPPSDIPYLENNISSTYYHPVSKNFVFNIKGGLKTINSLDNKDVKLSDRKFLTNKVLRGFESYGVGPIDGKDHIGGNYSAYTSVSSTIPNYLPDKWNASSIIFFDLGNVWGVDFDESMDSNHIRSSTGISLEWISPLGPINLTYAEAISKKSKDIEENFSFQIGTTF